MSIDVPNGFLAKPVLAVRSFSFGFKIKINNK